MKHHLEVYTCRLTALGPVFIGSGSNFSKKEYLFLDGFRTVGIADMEKLYGLAVKKGLREALESYMLETDGEQESQDLGSWMAAAGFSREETGSCLRYTLDSGDTLLQQGARVKIRECVKDPYGNPYIPGSSLKGMLRTILLAGRIAGRPKTFERSADQAEEAVRRARRARPLGFLRKEAEEVELAGLYRLSRNEYRKRNAVNDELSGMLVSDSRPLRKEDLVLCQKADRHTDGTEQRLNVLRECIRPGTAMEFTITIEKNICSVRKEELCQAAATFCRIYEDCFLRAFAGADRPEPGQVYLGGGAGFVSKTVLYPLLGRTRGVETAADMFCKMGVPAAHGHDRDRQAGVSPHTMKGAWYQGQWMEMGKCRLEILDEEGGRQ